MSQRKVISGLLSHNCTVMMTSLKTVPELCSTNLHKVYTSARVYHFLLQPYKCTQTWSHLPRVLNDLDILLAKLIRVELQEPLGNLRQRSELWLFVDVFLPILILKEALKKKGRLSETGSWLWTVTVIADDDSRFITWSFHQLPRIRGWIILPIHFLDVIFQLAGFLKHYRIEKRNCRRKFERGSSLQSKRRTVSSNIYSYNMKISSGIIHLNDLFGLIFTHM